MPAKKGKGRRSKTKRRASSNVSDEDSDSHELITERWDYDLQQKSVDPKFDNPHLIRSMRGHDLTKAYIEEHGFTQPLLFETPEGLNMTLPDSKFTVDDVKKLVGPRREVEVVRVSTQRSKKMTVGAFVQYYKKSKAERDKAEPERLNVLSLEFSKTPLQNKVRAPRIVKQLDWVEQVWPLDLKEREDADNKDVVFYPKVQNYCLISVEKCYTDFHVDFAGTSVWYHVLRGAKTFWLIPPTQQNLKMYEEWCMSPNQNSCFFGDIVADGECHRVHLQPGNTFFIPAGWVHGVYTPEDSLVFGGNFLHDYGIPIQLSVYQLENRTRVGKKYRYPYFMQILWMVANKFVQQLTGRDYYVEPEGSIQMPLLAPPKRLSAGVEQGLEDEKEDEEENNSADVPETDPAAAIDPSIQDPRVSHTPYLPPTEWNIANIRKLTKWERDGMKALADFLSDSVKTQRGRDEVPIRIRDYSHLLLDLKKAYHNVELEGIAQSIQPDPYSPAVMMSGPILNTKNEETPKPVEIQVKSDIPEKKLPAKKRKSEGMRESSSHKKPVPVIPDYRPAGDVVPLGKKPLQSFLRRTPGSTVTKPFQPRKPQRPLPNNQFDFAQAAFENPTHQDELQMEHQDHLPVPEYAQNLAYAETAYESLDAPYQRGGYSTPSTSSAHRDNTRPMSKQVWNPATQSHHVQHEVSHFSGPTHNYTVPHDPRIQRHTNHSTVTRHPPTNPQVPQSLELSVSTDESGQDKSGGILSPSPTALAIARHRNSSPGILKNDRNSTKDSTTGLTAPSAVPNAMDDSGADLKSEEEMKEAPASPSSALPVTPVTPSTPNPVPYLPTSLTADVVFSRARPEGGYNPPGTLHSPVQTTVSPIVKRPSQSHQGFMASAQQNSAGVKSESTQSEAAAKSADENIEGFESITSKTGQEGGPISSILRDSEKAAIEKLVALTKTLVKNKIEHANSVIFGN